MMLLASIFEHVDEARALLEDRSVMALMSHASHHV